MLTRMMSAKGECVSGTTDTPPVEELFEALVREIVLPDLKILGIVVTVNGFAYVQYVYGIFGDGSITGVAVSDEQALYIRDEFVSVLHNRGFDSGMLLVERSTE